MALSSWWSILNAKLAVSGRIYLVADMATDSKRAMGPNTLGMPFTFLSSSWIRFLLLYHEMRRFVYSKIRQEEYEGTL